MGTSEELKTKHLEMLQSIISRMAQNSFMVKGWNLTLVAALFSLAAKDSTPALVAVAVLPTFFFWYLDAYFLRQERLFRKLYDAVAEDVREAKDNVPLFDMKVAKHTGMIGSAFRIMLSQTLVAFYGALLLSEGVAAIILLEIDIVTPVKALLSQ